MTTETPPAGPTTGSGTPGQWPRHHFSDMAAAPDLDGEFACPEPGCVLEVGHGMWRDDPDHPERTHVPIAATAGQS